MPQATAPLNQEIVRRCIKYRLDWLTYANNSYFDGIVTDFAKDPIHTSRGELIAQYDVKNVLVTLNMRERDREPGKSLGAVRTNKQTFHLNCVMRLTETWKAAGWDVDSMRMRLAYDVEWKAFDMDQKLHGAADALGLDRPSCINLQIDKIVMGPVSAFPDVSMVLICSYEFMEKRIGA